MKTLSVSISNIEYQKFGLKNDTLSFSELIDLIDKELSKQNLNKCLELSEKYGLSKLTMDEITNEVKAVRKRAKSNY
ncbi:hypothetical protein [Mucilaginibacter arboris]|uniref:Uncharacterized protein n=1 Tax=Mucilaginibacter arboris TaxID=2682090 RepID=A0A7K1STQ4_9SPHI|nr:hypothetical protein [Mucilaginibacter arboris]MVN20691.1 hypothetical protein [Mucilaginibacter arboris]